MFFKSKNVASAIVKNRRTAVEEGGGGRRGTGNCNRVDKPSRAGGRICCVASLSMSAQHALNWKIKCKALPHVQARQTDDRKRERDETEWERESGEEGAHSLQLGPPRRHFNFMFLPLPDNVLLCLAICVCVRVCPWCAHVVATLPGPAWWLPTQQSALRFKCAALIHFCV